MSADERRFPLVQPPYDPKVQEAFDKVDMGELAPLNYLQVLAHHPRLMGNVVALGGSLMYRGKLDERLREIAIFRVAARTRSNYEWAMHRALFETRCAISAEQLAALKDGSPQAGCWNETEQLVIATVDELHDTSTVSEPTWTRLRARWAPPEILELLIVIGYYHMLAFFLNATGAVPERGARQFSTF